MSKPASSSSSVESKLEQVVAEANQVIDELEAEKKRMKEAAKRMFDAVLSPSAEQKILRMISASMRK